MSVQKNDEDLISKYMRTIKKTRNNRISYSERLKKYSQRWKVAIFIFNIEAILVIILSLNEHNEDMRFISAFFAIYIILLQHFINELNYSERSMKAHYHQLELRDLYLQLECLKTEKKSNEKELVELAKVNEIIINYQMSLKNNENHSRRDHLENTNKKEVPIPIDLSMENLFIPSNYLMTTFLLIFMFIKGAGFY